MLHNDVNLGDVSYNIQLHQKTINTKKQKLFPSLWTSVIFIQHLNFLSCPLTPLENIPNVESTPFFFQSRNHPLQIFFYIWPRSSYMYILSIFQNCHNLISDKPLTCANIFFCVFVFITGLDFGSTNGSLSLYIYVCVCTNMDITKHKWG